MTVVDLRPSPIAGTWYPGNAKNLAASVDGYFSQVHLPEWSGHVLGVIAPHAGHRYSGVVAAHAFATLRGLSPDLVVILSPFHQYDPKPLLTSKHQAYATPLGNIEIDAEALAELQSHLPTRITPIANDPEHAIEIELPFLQHIFTHPFKLLPIMIREQEVDTARQLGEALAKVLQNKNAILVASTDLSHFYDQNTAKSLDHEMLSRFESLKPESIFEAEYSGKGFACGHAAVAAVEWATLERGANKVQILKHTTSGDVTGDHSSVVGYGAAMILKQ